MQVHICQQPDWQEAFQKDLEGVASVTFGEQVSESAQILVKGTPTPEDLNRLSSLEAVVVPFAGIPVATREALRTRPNIDLYNLHHNAADTAEMAIALYMAVAKKLVVRDKNLREGRWSEGSFTRGGSADSVRAAGKHALILGYGAIGKRIANVCRAMEMRVTAVKKHGPFDEEVRPISELDDLLGDTQALFVALPLTPETEGLLDADRLSLLPATCIISNIARGKIFDEGALFEWLKSHPEAGAGIDVWWNYPKAEEPCLPSDYPFHELPNVVLTPHVGGSSDDSEADRFQALAHLIRQIIAGEARPASVEAGY